MVFRLVDLCVETTLPTNAVCDSDFFSLDGIIRIVRDVLLSNKSKFKFNYSLDEWVISFLMYNPSSLYFILLSLTASLCVNIFMRWLFILLLPGIVASFLVQHFWFLLLISLVLTNLLLGYLLLVNMRVYKNRRFHSKGPFRRCKGVVQFKPEDSSKGDCFKAPTSTFVYRKKPSKAGPAEPFMHDELLTSGSNPDRMYVRKLFNPSFIFDSPSPPSSLTPLGQHPTLSAMFNMNPSPYSSFKKPSTPSSSLGRNPDTPTFIPREIPPVPLSTFKTEVFPSKFSSPNPTFLANSPWSNPTSILPPPPYPFAPTNFSPQGRGLSPFNKWLRIFYITGKPYSECASYVNK